MHDPAAVLAKLGTVTIDGFADGTFIEWDYDVPNAIEAVPGVNITGHVKATNYAGWVQFTVHWRASQVLAKLNAMRKAAQAPGANLFWPLIVADVSGLSLVKLTKARFQSRPRGSYSTTGPSTRVFRFRGERLDCDELGYLES